MSHPENRRPLLRSLPLLVAGILAGTVLIQPAVGHVNKRLKHVIKHLNKVYINEGQAAGGSLKGTYPNPGIAANSVGSAELAGNSVTSAKIADGSITEADLNAALADAAGQFTVPAGKTIRGAVGSDVASETAGGDWGVIVSLPLKARNDLTDNDVHVNVSTWVDAGGQTAPTTTDTNAGCTGTVANPTAPAGDVCIYVTGGDNAADLFGYSVVPGTGGSPYGFKLNFTSVLAGDSYIDAVWAYTAP